MDFIEAARERAIKRAIPPEVLFAPDLAVLFSLCLAATRKRLARGDFGPRFKVGRRWAVRRDALLEHLAAIEALPEIRPGPAPVPRPNPAFVRLLRRHRGGGGR